MDICKVKNYAFAMNLGFFWVQSFGPQLLEQRRNMERAPDILR
jgi:hypothetical protein